MLQQQVPCVIQFDIVADRDHVARHDIDAAYGSVRSQRRLQFDLLQQAAEVLPVDVKGLVKRFESRIDVFLSKADPFR